jgi:RNA polymerase sigma-70 factor (ECF subfamily)
MAESSRELSDLKRAREEIELVKAAKRNPTEFGALYRRYVDPVFRYLYSRTGSVPDAEDAAAQTFLAAFETLGSLRQEEHFASWLFTIARHKAMDGFRAQKGLVSIEEVAEIAIDKDPLSEVIHSDQTALLKRLVAALPEEERELLRLRFLAGLSFAEMGRLLQRNEDAVKKTLYRLLARLHDQVEVQDD